MKKSLLILIILIFNHTLFSQHSKPDTLRAMQYSGPIKLDGILNEPCWSEAMKIENFTQREQNEGEPATEKTKIAVVYNTNEIYFGIWCFDSQPDKVSTQQMKRDFSWRSDDNVEVIIEGNGLEVSGPLKLL